MTPRSDSGRASPRPRTKFGLGADWMNDHADVALPWAKECVMTLGFSDSPSQLTFTFFFHLAVNDIRYDLLRINATPIRIRSMDQSNSFRPTLF